MSKYEQNNISCALLRVEGRNNMAESGISEKIDHLEQILKKIEGRRTLFIRSLHDPGHAAGTYIEAFPCFLLNIFAEKG